MKNRALKPYIFILLKALILYVLIPAMISALGFVEVIMVSGGWVYVMGVVGIIVYLNFIIVYIVPGLLALYDLITDSFLTANVTSENVVVYRRRHYYSKSKRGIAERLFMKIECSLGNGDYISLSTSIFCGMKKGQKSTVSYGKYSKIIISMLSENNEELLED